MSNQIQLKITLIILSSLSLTQSTFYPTYQDASPCTNNCYTQHNCIPSTDCHTLKTNTEWTSTNQQYTECQEKQQAESLPNSDWSTKFDKKKACHQRISQEEPNESMKQVQQCQSTCLDTISENYTSQTSTTCLSDSSCVANHNRCRLQCMTDNDCQDYSCYESKAVFDDIISESNLYCKLLKQKTNNILNPYQRMEPTHLNLFYKCLEYLNDRPSLSNSVQSTQNCWSSCSETMKTAINYDPSNPDHTKIEEPLEHYSDYYPPLSSLNNCYSSCNKQHDCGETCQQQMEAESFNTYYTEIEDCTLYEIKEETIDKDTWKEVYGLYQTCIEGVVQRIEEQKLKSTFSCYSGCVSDMVGWYIEQSCVEKGTCYIQHEECMDSCAEENECRYEECFGEDDFGKAIQVNQDCKRVMDTTGQIDNPYTPLTNDIMDSYRNCLPFIKEKYSNNNTTATINCWDKCIQDTTILVDNSSFLLSISLVVCILLL